MFAAPLLLFLLAGLSLLPLEGSNALVFIFNLVETEVLLDLSFIEVEFNADLLHLLWLEHRNVLCAVCNFISNKTLLLNCQSIFI